MAILENNQGGETPDDVFRVTAARAGCNGLTSPERERRVSETHRWRFGLVG